MKKMNKIAGLLLITLSVFFFGCEIGLGSSVDVDAPTVKITYPPEAAVARGTMVVKGTWDDDLKVTNVFVKLVNSSTNEESPLKAANINNQNWSTSFDTTLFIDGNYTIQAYSVDGTEKSSLVYSRSFDIDNTAPVLILSKPLATKGEEPSTFGRVLKLAGDISDKHAVKYLKFNYRRFESSGNYVDGTIDVKDFKNMSSEDPLIIAQYYDENDPEKNETLYKNYCEIYGDLNTQNNKFQDREILCTIALEDEAKVYDGNEDSSNGNITDRYFINSTNFYDTLMSEKSYGLTATRLMKIINGTYEGTDAEQILNIINNTENKFFVQCDALANDSLYSVLKLSPDNNPVYLVGGYTATTTTGNTSYNSFNLGSSILITVECGKDGTYIDESTLSITFTRDDGKTHTITGGWDEANGLTSISKEVPIEADSSDDPKVDGKYFFKTGSEYKIEVSGFDEKQVSIVAKNGETYGFILSSQTTAANVSTDSNDTYYSYKDIENEEVSLNLTITEENAKMFSGTYAVGTYSEGKVLVIDDKDRITFGDIVIKQLGGDSSDYENIKLVKKDIKITKVAKQPGKDFYTYDLTIKIGYEDSNNFQEGKGKYKVYIPVYIKDTQGNENKLTKQFYVDCDAPKILGFKEQDEVISYVNGTITISGTVTDNVELSEVKYNIGNKNPITITDTTKANPTITIDTTKETDNKDLDIVITATDKVGNKVERTLKYHVNQSLDQPVIYGSNFDTTIDNPDNIKYDAENNKTTNIFRSSDKLSGYITDDDGELSSAELKIYKYSNTSKKYDELVTIENQNSLPKDGKSFNNILLPKDAGIYKVEITVLDGKQEETGYNNVTKTFYIAIDNTSPTITETKIGSDAETYISGLVDFSFELSDDWDKDVLNENITTVVYDKDNKQIYPTVTPNFEGKATTGSISVDLSGNDYPQGKYKVEFTVTDRAGKYATVTRNLNKETNPPKFEDKPKILESNANGYYPQGILTFTGEASDEESGIAEVSYTINKVQGSEFLPMSLTLDENNTKKGTYKGKIDGLQNGNKVYFRAKDKAGNEKEYDTPIEIKIDSQGPQVSKVTKDNKEVLQTETIRINDDSELTFVIEATDNNESGIKTVKLTDYDVNANLVSGKYNLQIEKEKIKQTGSLYITLIDKVGNTTNYPICNIIYDKTAPNAAIKSLRYYNTENSLPLKENTENEYKDVNGKITISGTASDAELKTVELQYSEDGNNWSPIGAATETFTLNNWSFDVDTTKLTNEKTYQLRIKSTDETGNIGYSDVKKIYVDQDSDRPVITLTSTKFDSENNCSWLKNAKDLYFSVLDDDGDVKVEYSTDGTTYDEVSNNSISFSDDDTYTIYFKITEKNEETKKTWQSSTSENNVPKLVGNDDNPYTTSVLTLKVDTTLPNVTNVRYASYINDNNKPKEDDYKASTKHEELIFGGEYEKFSVKFDAEDNNGIKTAKIYRGEEELTDAVLDTPEEGSKTYTFTGISVKELESISYDYRIDVEDKAGMIRNYKFSILVDNTAPVIKTFDPMSGELEGTPFTIKGTVDDADAKSTIKFKVDTKAENYDASAADWDNAEDYNGGNAGITNWRLVVDGDINNTGTNAVPETHTKTHKQYFVEQYGESKSIKFNDDGKIVNKIDGKPYETVLPLYFHFLVSDKAGNKDTCVLELNIDPQGDIPSVKLEAPEVTNYAWYTNSNSVDSGKKWKYTNDLSQTYNLSSKITDSGNEYFYKGKATTLSGTINIQGSAEAKGGKIITGVYMQIDPEFNPVNGFNEAIWKGNSEEAVRSAIKVYNNTDTRNVSLSDASYKFVNFTTDNGQKVFGIEVGTETSWSKAINSGNYFGKKTGSNTVAIRLYAKDDAGKITTLNPLNDLLIRIDSEAPIFGQHEPFFLYQFAWKDTAGNVVYTNTAEPANTSKAYTNSGCTGEGKSIGTVGTNFASITVDGKTYSKAFVSRNYDEGKAWVTGEWWLRFSVHDEQDIYKIQVESNGITDEIVENDPNSKYTLKSENATVERHTDWNSSKDKGFIVNYKVGSNFTDGFGKFTLKFQATDYKNTEEDRKTSDRTINISYDNKKPTVDTSGKYYNISDYIRNSLGEFSMGTAVYEQTTESGFRNVVYYFNQKNTKKIYGPEDSAGVNYTSEQEIYTKTGPKVSKVEGNTITVDSTGTAVSANQLILLGGDYYFVTKVEGTKLTLDVKPSESVVGQKTGIVIGGVINKDSNSVTTNNTRYNWTAEFDSNNLPDGPIEINYVVFDKAGNYAHEKLDAIVGNNAPRIASVKVWCDYNQNETKDSGEYKTYYYNENNGKASEATDNLLVVGETKEGNKVKRLPFPTKTTDAEPAPFMTVKDVFKITPEIVGGTGELQYSYVYGNKETAINQFAGVTPVEKGSIGSCNIDGTGTSYLTNNQVTGALFEDKLTINSQNYAGLSGLTYFEYTIWDSTNYLTAYQNSLHAKIQLVLNVKTDSAAPVVNIGKFRYSKDDEYTYDEDNNKVYYKYKENENSTYEIPYSNVYGMDLTKGHVELTEDWINAPGYDDKKAEYDADPKVSGYITIRGRIFDDVLLNKITVTFPGIAASGVDVASVATTGNNKGKMVVASNYTKELTDAASTGLKFTILKEVNDENGHEIEWECSLDTAKVDSTNKVKVDSSFVVTATAKNGTTKTGNNTYRMDVVPYITNVTTSLNDTYKRSALGHYPLYATSDGFDSQNKVNPKNGSATISGFNFTQRTYTVSDTTTSSAYDFTVNGVKPLNNVNNNAAEYNLVDSILHQTLDDDVFFDIWDINTKAALPGDNMALEANMKINPTNGMIGFAFCNGMVNWSMPNMPNGNGKSTSYTNWTESKDFIQCSTFNYNSNGASIGVSMGGESGASYYDCYSIYYSKWGTDSGYSYDNTAKIRIGSLAQGGNFVKNRFQSSSITTLGTKTFLAYYDAINKEIRFESGEIPDNKGKFGTFNDIAGYYTSPDYNTQIANVQVVAQGASVTANYHSGPYVSIAACSDGAVVMVWYDDVNKCLWYSYRNKNQGLGTTGVNRTGWSTPTSLATGAGEYCQVAVDSANGVHIACYDKTNSALRYIKIPTYTAPSTNTSVLVDSYLNVGKEITIDVAKVGNNQIPYIGYWGNTPKKPRYAYLAKPAATDLNGVKDDKYTGVWEVEIVPTPSTVYQTNERPVLMNVAVWKVATGNNKGNLTNSYYQENGTTKRGNNWNYSTADTSTGNCYGNGSNNGVMGYVISTPGDAGATQIEVAQMRGSTIYSR